ncbi:MAG: group 1 truncated hemoglobin [Dehalococcoidia bacterium]
MSTAPEKSLYERLGGYDAIAAATDDLLQRLTSDPEIGFYWRGHSTDSMKRDRQLIVDFLCASIGGPVIYRGRDMKTSHVGLNITEREWEVFVAHTVATLEHFQVPEPEKQEFLDCAASLKGEIVEKP